MYGVDRSIVIGFLNPVKFKDIRFLSSQKTNNICGINPRNKICLLKHNSTSLKIQVIAQDFTEKLASTAEDILRLTLANLELLG